MQATLVRLRPLSLADAAHYARLLGADWESIKTTGSIPYPCTEAAAREWLAQRLDWHPHMFAILRQPEDEFVGAIGLVEQVRQTFEIGYWVGRKYAGNGYASAAVQLVIALARSLKARKLLAGVFPENKASARILEKAGFIFTGAAEMDFPLRGGWRTNHEYELNLS
ncbi:MAG: GNAT family N-acetyltransferase [Acidobacteria bacterium]|nr:GNAT family N-acetyltransferase [Acidobacteriota bacterium]MBI3423253.1 GNAT family N-acetyltransferase [Acidobacteriota bacterium]